MMGRKQVGGLAGGTVGDGVGAAVGAGGTSDPSVESLSYEDALGELERLVASIEQGDVGLEASLASYRRGEQLLRHCKALLDRAEATVRQLTLPELESGSDSSKPARPA